MTPEQAKTARLTAALIVIRSLAKKRGLPPLRPLLALIEETARQALDREDDQPDP